MSVLMKDHSIRKRYAMEKWENAKTVGDAKNRGPHVEVESRTHDLWCIGGCPEGKRSYALAPGRTLFVRKVKLRPNRDYNGGRQLFVVTPDKKAMSVRQFL